MVKMVMYGVMYDTHKTIIESSSRLVFLGKLGKASKTSLK